MKIIVTSPGTFILSRQGKEIEVTDLNAALQEAKEAVRWHDNRKKLKSGPGYQDYDNVLYFPEAHKDWEHTLLELEKIKMKTDKIFV
jgi:hypothetical protein